MIVVVFIDYESLVFYDSFLKRILFADDRSRVKDFFSSSDSFIPV